MAESKYTFTASQETAMAELVVDNWGCNMQTSIGVNGIPYIYFKRSPDAPTTSCAIYPDGTVVFEPAVVWDGKEFPDA